jgi:hypothetical protein
MTRKHGHVLCDTPGCGACTPEDSERVERWDVLAGGDQPEAHLCERCADRRDAGGLADPSVIICARCGRTSAQGVTRWWVVEDARGEWISVCDGCHAPGDARVV